MPSCNFSAGYPAACVSRKRKQIREEVGYEDSCKGIYHTCYDRRFLDHFAPYFRRYHAQQNEDGNLQVRYDGMGYPRYFLLRLARRHFRSLRKRRRMG